MSFSIFMHSVVPIHLPILKIQFNMEIQLLYFIVLNFTTKGHSIRIRQSHFILERMVKEKIHRKLYFNFLKWTNDLGHKKIQKGTK